MANLVDATVAYNNAATFHPYGYPRTAVAVTLPSGEQVDVYSGGTTPEKERDYQYSLSLLEGQPVKVNCVQRGNKVAYYLRVPHDFVPNSNFAPASNDHPSAPPTRAAGTPAQESPEAGDNGQYETEYQPPVHSVADGRVYEAMSNKEMRMAQIQMAERKMIIDEAIPLAFDVVKQMINTIQNYDFDETGTDTDTVIGSEAPTQADFLKSFTDMAIHISLEVLPYKLHTQNLTPITYTTKAKSLWAKLADLHENQDEKVEAMRKYIYKASKQRTDSMSLLTNEELAKVEDYIEDDINIQ